MAIFHITTKFTRTHHANHLHILSTKCFSSMDKGRDKGIRSSLQSPSLQWLSKQWSTSFQKYPSLQKLHHSRSDITPEATSRQKGHHSRSNIIPEATLLQKQNLSNSPPSFQQFHHFFDHCHSSRSQHSSGQCHCRVPHQRGDDNHTADPFISVGLTNTAVLSMQLPPTLRRYSSPWWILSTWSPKLHHTNYARRFIIHQTPMQQSAPLPISHLSGLHHLRSARHISTSFMIVKPILHLRGQNKLAQSHKHSAP